MTQFQTTLPKECKAYLLRRGDGERYVFGRQVATIIADAVSSGGVFELATIAGGKGEQFPVHLHENTYESILVLEGRVELMLDGDYYLLTAGDYAHIPPGTKHAYRLMGHRNAFASYTVPGGVSNMYRTIGDAYSFVEPPAEAHPNFDDGHLERAARTADVRFTGEQVEWGTAIAADHANNPGTAAPYVIENGEGERLLTGDQLHRLVASQKNTNGDYIFILSDGPKGDPIVEHYHEHHTETFFCLQGQMTMWANGEEIVLFPGDFLHVPPGTVHAYRLDTHYTKVAGLLASGLFEPFFRTLGEPYEHYTFPAVPGPLRMDRVMANMANLDLNVVAKSPLDRK
ncbi:quercetin 2,3-dioxygenase [Saccharibacillus kuerlensis]|uniref:Quercetin 2,3-dioxygenase n=2 Tax=Saccharibacillus kuerlensis TaxID=459527 RepID=A0ABQ2L6I4_9BACL|nr:quercetin 2,3-dioxygenase [Saccharibacillus kuerlensis]GGO01670.1 quercetin 2,3-dioxygenase [Saccharibacillus kuerlensis]